jgi:hypothetical protein
MRSSLIVLAAVLAIAAKPANQTIAIPDGETVAGRCVGVHDGDTITLLVDTQEGKTPGENPSRRYRWA